MDNTNTSVNIPTDAAQREPSQDEKIAMLMNLYMNLMDSCKREKINFENLGSAAQALWCMRNNISSYYSFSWAEGK